MKRYVCFLVSAIVALLAMAEFFSHSAMAQGTGLNSISGQSLLLNAGGYTGSPAYITILPEGAAGAGNIGIGTSSPSTLLHLLGSPMITLQNTSNQNGGIQFRNNSMVDIGGFFSNGATGDTFISAWGEAPLSRSRIIPGTSASGRRLRAPRSLLSRRVALML